MGQPVIPPIHDCVVEIEYRETIVFLVGPLRCTVRQSLRKKQHRSRRTTVSVPEVRLRNVGRIGRWIGGFMTTRQQQRAPHPFRTGLSSQTTRVNPLQALPGTIR